MSTTTKTQTQIITAEIRRELRKIRDRIDEELLDSGDWQVSLSDGSTLRVGLCSSSDGGQLLGVWEYWTEVGYERSRRRPLFR